MVAFVGYLVFATGTLLLTRLALTEHGRDRPFLVLLICRVPAGITHVVVRGLWRACGISAIGSVVVGTVLVLLLNQFNEMFMVGVMMWAFLGAVFSMVMGIPVVVCENIRKGFTRDRSREQR